jgi:hypothetical protein
LAPSTNFSDILFFTPISDTLDELKDADFLCCDYHFKARKLSDIFSTTVIEQAIFTPEELQDVFNSGLWGSKKGIFELEQFYNLLRECAAHREYFDFSGGTTDQPLMNYLVLKGIQHRTNLAKTVPNEPGSWAGMAHFQEKDHILYDKKQQRLRYLHWAGQPMRPGGPYRSLWEYYRYLDSPEERPPTVEVAPETHSPWCQWLEQTRNQLRKFKQALIN